MLYRRKRTKHGRRETAVKYLTQLHIKWIHQRSSETVQSNRTIMAVGRERGNLYKSLFICCLQIKDKKRSSQAICLYRCSDTKSLFSFYTLKSQGIVKI